VHEAAGNSLAIRSVLLRIENTLEPEFVHFLGEDVRYIRRRYCEVEKAPVAALWQSQESQQPQQPDRAGWLGERTSDEMCVALSGVIFDNEAVLRLPFSSRGQYD